MSAKERAIEIFNQHIEMAQKDGRAFRKTVMNQIMAEFGCTVSAAATHYNNAKKANPVDGLGRATPPKGARKVSTGQSKPAAEIPDEECFTVLEILRSGEVGRCQSYTHQGDASEGLDERAQQWPSATWVLIQGLGPNPGEAFKLGYGEKEIRRVVGKKTVTSLMSGKEVQIPVDTPACCDPSTETYWSM